MELEEFKASHFDNIDELIKTCKLWINDDDYEAYCRFFDMGAMEELIKEITRIKEESIPRAAIEKKIDEYKELLLSCNKFSDVDRIKAINERILVLQEILKESK